MLSNTDALDGRLTPQIASTFDTALQGCALTLSVLDDELGGFFKETRDHGTAPRRFKYVLEKDHLQELLQQIRGQQMAVTLLLQTYQSESLAEIKQSLHEYKAILQQLSRRGRSLWQESHHQFGPQKPPETIYGSEDSIFELSSLISSTQFDFDDEIIDSKAYRRALANVGRAVDASVAMQASLPLQTTLQEIAEHSVHAQDESAEGKRVAEENASALPADTTSLEWKELPKQERSISSISNKIPEVEIVEQSVSHSSSGKAGMMESRTALEVPVAKETSNPISKVTPNAQQQVGNPESLVQKPPDRYFRLKLVIIGDSCSGKSALLIRMTGRTPPQYLSPTIFENYVAMVDAESDHVEMALWDTAGITPDYDRLRPLSYPDSHVGLICFNIGRDYSLENVEEMWFPEWHHFCKGLPFILVGCHKDLRDDPNHAKAIEKQPDYWTVPVTHEQGAEVARRIGAAKYMECSSTTTEGVMEILREAAVLGIQYTEQRAQKSIVGRFSRLFRTARKAKVQD